MIEYLYLTVTWEPIGTSIRVRVDLELIAMKKYSRFLKARGRSLQRSLSVDWTVFYLSDSTKFYIFGNSNCLQQ